MRINSINQYYNIQPKNNFCGSTQKPNENLASLPAYKMPDFEAAKAYGCVGLSSIDKTLVSTSIKDVKFRSEKSNDELGTYGIALENPKNINSNDTAAFELYKCKNNLFAIGQNNKLNQNGKGKIKSVISKDTVVFILKSEPKDMKKYITYLNFNALDLTTTSVNMFNLAKEVLTDYYKDNWDKIKNSKNDKDCVYSALKNEQSLEEALRKIDEVKYEDYLKFVNKFKNKESAYIMLSLPENIYNDKSKKEEIEKTALDNIITNKLEIVKDLQTNK